MTHILNSLSLIPLPPFPNRDQITNTTALLLKQAFSELLISWYSIFHIPLHPHLHLHLKRSKQSAGNNQMNCGQRCPRVGFRRSVSTPFAPAGSPALQLPSSLLRNQRYGCSRLGKTLAHALWPLYALTVFLLCAIIVTANKTMQKILLLSFSVHPIITIFIDDCNLFIFY